MRWRAVRLRLSCPYAEMGVPSRTVARGSPLIFSSARLKHVYSTGCMSSSFTAAQSTVAATASPEIHGYGFSA